MLIKIKYKLVLMMLIKYYKFVNQPTKENCVVVLMVQNYSFCVGINLSKLQTLCADPG